MKSKIIPNTYKIETRWPYNPDSPWECGCEHKNLSKKKLDLLLSSVIRWHSPYRVTAEILIETNEKTYKV